MFALSSACGVGSRIQREELGLPLLHRQAELRIARHHVAGAQRKAQRVEARVDVAREGEQPLAPRVARRAASAAANSSALSWSVANVCSPRPSLPSASQHQSMSARSCRCQHEIDRPARQRVVERGDRPRQRLGAHALREQVLREPADVLAGALQRVDRVGGVQLLRSPAASTPAAARTGRAR